MTGQASADFQDLFNAMVTKHGGAERLSALDVEIVTICCRTMVAMRTADPSEAARMAQTVSLMVQTLPAPLEDTGEMMDLTRLSSAELVELERLQCKACNTEVPAWCADDDIPPAPEVTQRERTATQLALWLNEREERFRFGGCTDERERIHLRNEVGGLLYPLDAKSLWREIYMADAQGMIETAVRKALAAVGSDAQITPATAAECAQIEPPEIPRINDGGITSDYPPFSFNGGGKQ